MQITGKIIKVMPIQSGVAKSGNAWRKQEVVIETLDRYPKQVCIEAMNDNVINSLATVGLGQVVTIDFDLSSREFNGRYYTTVSAWRISTSQNPQ